MSAGAAADDVGPVLRHYPLDSPLVTGRDETGIVNANWFVSDGVGKRYILRRYLRVIDPERVLFQLRFQEHLRANRYPTAEVIATRTGELFVEEADKPWALFAYVEGDEFDFDRIAQAEEAGRQLARFQAVAESSDESVAPAVPGEVEFSTMLAPPSSHMWSESVLAPQHDARLRELFSAKEFEADLAYFREWRVRAAEKWSGDRLAALSQSWLHCDYHGRNMVFRGDEMVGLFDFDFLTYGPRVFDVARGVFNFGRERRASTTLRENFVATFLRGYESEAPLSPAERESLGFMAVLNWTPDAGFYNQRRPEEGDERIARRLRFDLGMMRAIGAEMKRLAPQFGWAVV